MIEILTDTRLFTDNLKSRMSKTEKTAEAAVEKIIEDIKQNGDAALFKYTKQFDGFDANGENIKVSQIEIEAAYNELDKNLLDVIRLSISRVGAFHQKQMQNGWIKAENGETLGQLVVPMECAGVYVPGGKAAYPSSVIMNVIPAKVAGVKRIIMATPCGPDGKIPSVTLAAANEAGADEIYKIGGAQAIAAFAFGTESIPKADIITGPGNMYVAAAKKKVFGHVAIDSVAGPSEIVIVADETANPKFAAADMLSQAEHDEEAMAVLITESHDFAKKTADELTKMVNASKRRKIAEASLKNNGKAIIVRDKQEAAKIVNQIAPEHLELCTNDNNWFLGRIHNAGAIFLGNYSPEPIGDYMAGPNHVLPTAGSAASFSALGVDVFLKKISLISFEKEAFNTLAPATIAFAEAEGLYGHADSVRIRLIQNS